MKEAVWVTGFGSICAAGENAAAMWQAVSQGLRPQSKADGLFPEAGELPVCAVQDTWVTTQKAEGWRAGFCRDSSTLLLHAAREALLAGSLETLPSKSGICIGTTAGCALNFLKDYSFLRKKTTGTPPETYKAPSQGMQNYTAINDFFQHSMALDVAANLCNNTNISGPALTISNACTSGADAIGMAAAWIKSGLCDVALAGGTDALSVIPYIGFTKLMIYSPEPCKPFDTHRKGLNLGEGAGVLLLESASHAKRRGVRPKAVFSGYGAAADAYHLTAPHPQGRGLQAAMAKALRQAGTKINEIAFINTHGTATPENDKAESLVYSKHCKSTPLWASKGVTGHCLGAAGAIEAILTIQALEAGIVPPCVGCDTPEEAVADQLVLAQMSVKGNTTLSVSLGFGGSSAALVFSLPGRE